MNSLKALKSKTRALLAGLAFGAAGLAAAQASSTYITFSVNMANAPFTIGTDTVSVNGTFNGYGSYGLVQEGSSTIFTNTVNDTSDANGASVQYKFVIDGNNWENTASGQNRASLLPSTSGASLVLPTPYFSDDGPSVTNEVTFQVDVSQQISLGNFIPGTSSVEVRGLFNSWSGGVSELTADPSILETNQFGLVTANVWVGTFPVTGSPAGAEGFKYVINPGTIWESPDATDSDGGGNRYFANVAQTLPVVNFSDAPYAPLAQITFSVNMSAVLLTDTNYNPGSLTLNGDFNGWSAGVPMTNNPSSANTNIYYAVVTAGEGSLINFQYRYTELSSDATVYDHLDGVNGGNNNRTYTVPASPVDATPTVFFNDAALDDYLTQATPVLFSVNMANAVGTDSHVFDPTEDSVYINGQFADWYAWSGGVNPAPAPAGYQMMEVGVSSIYTNTVLIPPGTPVAFDYKYGMDPYSQNGGPIDDEAASGANHYRVVRSTVISPYPMPVDTFGNQYNEPFFSSINTAGGDLATGPSVAGAVPVTWLGRPGAHLQATTNLAGGVWQDLPATDGTNWISGYSSTNGFVSQTNWPVAGKTFFRLVKPQ